MEYTPLVFMAVMFVLFAIAGCMNQVDWFSYKEPVPDPRPKLSKYLRYSSNDFNDLSTETQYGWWIEEKSPTGYIPENHYWDIDAMMAVPIGYSAEKCRRTGKYKFETSAYGMG
jgi:hypothetical protein